MCDPVSLAVSSFMVSAGSAVAGFGAQKQSAAAQDQLYADNKANAERSAIYEHQQLDRRAIQEDNAMGEKSFDNMLDTRAKAAAAEAEAADGGFSGLSVDSLIRDVFGAGGRTNDRIKENGDMTLSQINAEHAGVEARRVDRTNSVKHGVQPSGLALGLNIASGGLNAATSYAKMTK